MVTGALFDTNILIDYLRGNEDARRELDRCSGRAISIITWMEVMAGATLEDEDRLRAFLISFYTLPLTAETAERAVVLRRNYRIKLPDAIILATAETAGLTLFARNSRDFPPGTPGVKIPYHV